MMARSLRNLSETLLPGGILLTGSMILHAQGVPPRFQPALTLLPTLTYIFGLVLGWSLDRARTLIAMVFLVTADRTLNLVVLGAPATDSVASITFGIIALLLPINFLALAVLGERGLLRPAILVPLGLLLVEGLGLWSLDQSSNHELAMGFMAPFIDSSWTAWSPLPQPALAVFAVAFVILIVQFSVTSTAIVAGSLWSLSASYLALRTLSEGRTPSILLGSAAAIICWSTVASYYRGTYRDELTGIRGHLGLDRALTTLGRRYAIAILDVDRLRDINDESGEEGGDRVLETVGDVLRTVSEGGTAYRYSGEEFAVLFRGRSSRDALLAMEDVRKRIERLTIPRPGRILGRRRNAQSTSLSVTVSIGIADCSNPSTNASAVIRAAYRAVAQAKLDGGNRVTRATPTSLAPPRARAGSQG